VGSRKDGQVLEGRQEVKVRTTRVFAQAVREFADDLGVPVSAVWVLGVALLVSRERHLGAGMEGARARALVEDVRAQVSSLLP